MGPFCFVILHYQTWEDTRDCVDSILKLNSGADSYIIVVDNGSPNKSGFRISELYKENCQVTVILSEKNLGFTAGNNIGFLHAKEKLKAAFIAMINNDTIIDQSDFIDRISNIYQMCHFDILGPDIVTPAGRHQNPVFNKLSSLAAVRNYLRFYKRILLLNYLGLDDILERVKKFFIPKSNIHLENIKVKQDFASEQSGVMLHGSAMIFSETYISRYDGLHPGPFMYGEEAILDFIARRDKLITLYSPDIRIIHKDDSATNQTYRKPLKKRRFYLKNFVVSLQILESLMREKNRNNNE